MAPTQKDIKPLPLGETLRDLAVLRVSGQNLSSLVPPLTTSRDLAVETETDASVHRSQEFIKAARSAIKMQDTGAVDIAGRNLESLRGGLDDISQGLDMA